MNGRLFGWLVVCGGLLFAAGACLGYLGFTWAQPDRTVEEIPLDPTQAGPSIQLTNKEVWDRLGLDPDQRVKAEGILSDHFQRIRRLREEREVWGTKVEADLLALLDEGQQEKMLDIIREIKIVEVAGKVSDRLARYERDLALDPGAVEPLYTYLIQHQLDRDNLFRTNNPWRRGKSFDRAEFEKTLARLQEELLAKVEKILTGEQFAKFKEMESRERGPWGGRGGRRPPSGSPRPARGAEGEHEDSHPDRSAPPPEKSTAPDAGQPGLPASDTTPRT